MGAGDSKGNGQAWVTAPSTTLVLSDLSSHLCDSPGVSHTHRYQEAPGTQHPGYCQGQAPLITESYLKQVHSKPRASFHIKDCKKAFIKIQLKKIKTHKNKLILSYS